MAKNTEIIKTDFDIFVQKINKLIDLWEYNEALNICLEELDENPQHDWIKDLLVNIYINLWKDDEAQKYLKEWDINKIKKNKEFSKFAMKINNMIDLWEYNEAEKLCLEELEKDEQHNWVKELLYFLYTAKWDEKKANIYWEWLDLESFTQKNKEFNNFARNINNIIDSWDYDKAEKLCLEELEKDKQHNWVKELLYFLYVGKWDMEKANIYSDWIDVELLTKKNLKFDEFAKKINNLIDSWNYDEAEKLCLKELEKDKQHNWIRELLYFLYIGKWDKEKANMYK